MRSFQLFYTVKFILFITTNNNNKKIVWRSKEREIFLIRSLSNKKIVCTHRGISLSHTVKQVPMDVHYNFSFFSVLLSLVGLITVNPFNINHNAFITMLYFFFFFFSSLFLRYVKNILIIMWRLTDDKCRK